MQIVIDIPKKEFGVDIDDKFQDFFSRLKAEIKAHLISGTDLVCGAYELETIDMFLEAFNNGTPLLGHGDLVDRDAIQKAYDYSDMGYSMIDALNDAQIIIKADTENEGKE